jgi:hypothetical protein
MRHFMTAVAVATVLAVVAGDALAQQQGRGGQGRGGQGRGGAFGVGGGMGRGMGVDRLALLNIEAVQQELDLSEDQLAQVTALREETQAGRRGQRGQRGEGGERPDFRNMSEEERNAFMEERRKEREEQAKAELAKISEILEEDQVGRLNELWVQAQGIAALQNPEIAAKLQITDDQREELREVSRDLQEEMMAEMRELRNSGDREAVQAKMAELRKEMEEEVLDVLNDSQKQKFAALKGEPMEGLDEALRESQRRNFGGQGFGEGRRGGEGRGGEGRGGEGRRGRRGGAEGRPQAEN